MPSLEEAIGAVRQAESRLRITSEPPAQNSAALLTRKPETRTVQSGTWTQRQSSQNPTLGTEGEDSRDALVCAYCKKRRHTKENCWKLAWKSQNAGKKAYVSITQPQTSSASVTSPESKKCKRN